MATKKKTIAKKTVPKKRQFKAPTYKSFRMHKRIKSPQPKLPSVWVLWKTAFKQLGRSKRVFFGITLIYALLILVFVRGLSGGLNALELKANLDMFLDGTGGALGSGLAVFGALLGSASATNGDLASLYQTVILIMVSLAFIWALRQSQTNAKIRITTKEVFYKSQAPAVPFLLVVVVMCLQLIPIALANFLYALVIAGGYAASAPEKVLWYLLIFLLFLFSLYMLSSSLFAAYIVTLPDTRPMQALRTARELVRYRRWTVMRKVFVLPLALTLILAIVTVPSILLIPALAEWIFFLSSLLLLPLLHSYMYALYRAMLWK